MGIYVTIWIIIGLIYSIGWVMGKDVDIHPTLDALIATVVFICGPILLLIDGIVWLHQKLNSD